MVLIQNDRQRTKQLFHSRRGKSKTTQFQEQNKKKHIVGKRSNQYKPKTHLLNGNIELTAAE